MTKTVIANGIRMGYNEQGQGEPLMLIMGLGADGSRWEDHVRVFEKYFRCILVDNRGAGASDKPHGEYTTEMMADDTASLMDAIGIEHARVVGISMGAGIAQNLSLRHPQKVRCMGLVSGWARCDEYMTTVFQHFRKIRATASPADFMQLLQLWIYTARYYENYQADLLKGQATAYVNAMPQHAFEAQCSACINHQTVERLGKITVPTLITVGDMDIFTPLPFSQELHDGLVGSDLCVFQGCGHAHHWEKLDEFNQLMLKFLLTH